MSLPVSADKPPATTAAADENPCWWKFNWEAQSHTPTLRLLLFNTNINTSAQCKSLKLSLSAQQSLLTVSFLESKTLIETSVQVPVPRVLIDTESPPHFRAFDDHIEVKLVLLLPVDHPLVSDFDSILNVDENRDGIRPLTMDSDLKKLSCMKEVHFFCRNCSSKLTKGLRCFKEMPSVNWRDAADNWFGNCCCSFGGVSEKLVAEYAKSYTCAPGVCLLNTATVLLCKNDLLGCKLLDLHAKKATERDLNSPSDNCLNTVSPNEVCRQVETGCCGNHSAMGENISVDAEYGSSKHLVDDDNLSRALMDSGNIKLLENQKVFLDGYLGNGFMVRSSGLSKDIRWIEYLCPQCSCLVGAYPCFDDGVPLDDGVRLFKCSISTCLPLSGSNDAFGSYTLERMFASQLLESAQDELSFRTIVRDMQSKSPVLQIVLLNPNSWSSAGSLHPAETAAKLVMHPSVKVLFSDSIHGMEFDPRALDDWVRKNQADEIYMFASQIHELIRVLGLAKSLSPPSCTSLQGLFLSSMRR